MSTTAKRKPGPGRPPGSLNKNPKGPMPQHQFRCTPELWTRFLAVVQSRGIASEGEAIRSLLLAECERFEGKTGSV